MSAQKVRGNYEELARIAQSFKSTQGNAENTLRNVRGQTEVLRGGDWIGKGATKFYQEMDSAILPSLQRLTDALEEAAKVTTQISQIIKQAENEAARILDKEPGNAVDGNAASQSITTSFTGMPHSLNALGDDRQPPQTQAATPGARDGNYTVGPPKRPNIHHDNGFSDFPKENPTPRDYLQLTEWRALLEASKLATKLGVKDLDDANDAYEHYLTGGGKDRIFSLDEYFREDDAGRVLLDKSIQEAQLAAEQLATRDGKFQITSDAGAANAKNGLYPRTENWQKTIGAFSYWSSADVNVVTIPDGRRQFTMDYKIHAEDRYNFNPNQNDIASGVSDNANGRFEVTGLANPYMSRGEAKRTVTWIEGELPKVAGQDPIGPARDSIERGGAPGPRGGSPRPAPTPRVNSGDYATPPWPSQDRIPDRSKNRPS